MSFKVPNQYRIHNGPMGSEDSIGLCGAFKIPIDESDAVLYVIATDGKETQAGWEHVSVHGDEEKTPFTPSWQDMCNIKKLFWDDEDCVIQYHPPKSDYVNVHPHTLHLWRHPKTRVSLPPKNLIG